MTKISKNPILFYAALLSIMLFLLMAARVVFLKQSLNLREMMLFDQILTLGGFIGFFIFWGICLADFFINANVKNRILWGFSLLFFSWAASIIYFVKYFWLARKSALSL
jgi:hypothetical protein